MPEIAYIYLVIPGEKYPQPNLYKIGKTVHRYTKSEQSRIIRRLLNEYKGGEILGLYRVPILYIDDIETAIIRDFNTRFRVLAGHREFFFGDWELMKIYIEEKVNRIGNFVVHSNLFDAKAHGEFVATEVVQRTEALLKTVLGVVKPASVDQAVDTESLESHQDQQLIPPRTLFDLYKAVTQGHDRDRDTISRWLNANIDLYFTRDGGEIMCRLHKHSRSLVAFTEEHDFKITHIEVSEDHLPLRIDTYSLFNIVMEFFDVDADELKETSVSFKKPQIMVPIAMQVATQSPPASPIDEQKTSCGMPRQLIRQNLRKYVRELRERCLKTEGTRLIYCEQGVSWAFIFTKICYFLFGRMVRQHKTVDPKLIEDMLLEDAFLKITDAGNSWFQLLL